MAWRATLAVALIAVRAVVLSVVLSHVPADPGGHYVASDALRYTAIAETPGTPYRDFDVEIPPVEVVALELIASSDPRETAVRNGWFQFTLDVVTAAALMLGWGSGAALLYLLIGLPLAPFLYFRLDLLSVSLATTAMALARRGRPRGAGTLLAAAVLAKVWPIVLITAAFGRSRRQMLLWGGTALILGTIAWALWAGPDGPMQVATFRGATGWQLESPPGSILLAGTDLSVVFEEGANRIGRMTTSARVLSASVLVGALALIARAAHRREDDTDGLVALASVGALLACAPIVSWQYVGWLLPWAAIVAGERRWWTAGSALAVVALSTALVFQGVPLTARSDLAVALLLARNAVLVALPIVAYAALRRSPSPVGGLRRTTAGVAR